MSESVIDNAEPPKDSKEAYVRWSAEISAARDDVKKWHERGDRIVKRYLDDRDDNRTLVGQRLNLFTSNTQNMEALLYGKTPEVGVQRRYADSSDDVARVASEMLERLLNTDIERDDDTQQEAFKSSLSDRLIPGLGTVWLRYDMGEVVKGDDTPAQMSPDGSTELAPAVPGQEKRPNESVPVDYVYWKDMLWSPCKVWSEVRWASRAADMSREQFNERFPDAAKLNAFTPNKKQAEPGAGDETLKVKDHLARCRVYEIWSKDDRSVCWITEGYSDLLDEKPDPLELQGFWPFPRPMFANLTTSRLMPTPDFHFAQDLYNEVDDLSTRIMMLEQAVRVVGAYDKNNTELARMVNETDRRGNEMIAVDSWAMFAEKGGIKGVVDWFPIDMVVNALQVLREYRTEVIGLLFQITGMSDIMRGQASEQATATEQAIKARFASVRVQTLQDEFARFASDTQRIKAEIIAKHFDPQTIIDRSNIMRTPDAALAGQAVQLIQSDFYQWRISVNPDSVSLTDFAALKQERFEFANTIASYFQSMIPFVQMLGQAAPGAGAAAVKFVIGLAQQMAAGLKGAQDMEGIFDQFVAQLEQAAQQPPPPPRPDPKAQTEMIKARATGVKAQAEQVAAKGKILQTGLELQKSIVEHKQSMEQSAADHARAMQNGQQKALGQAVADVNAISEDGPT